MSHENIGFNALGFSESVLEHVSGVAPGEILERRYSQAYNNFRERFLDKLRRHNASQGSYNCAVFEGAEVRDVALVHEKYEWDGRSLLRLVGFDTDTSDEIVFYDDGQVSVTHNDGHEEEVKTSEFAVKLLALGRATALLLDVEDLDPRIVNGEKVDLQTQGGFNFHNALYELI